MTEGLKWKENWDRSYRISIGTRETKVLDPVIQTATVTAPSIVLEPKDSDYTTIPSNAVLLSNLESDDYDRRGFTFRFNTMQKASSEGSEGENTFLELYNIDKTLIDIINQDKCIVIVEAGYDQQVELVYSGDVVDVSVDRQGSDTIYRLKCSSGGLPMRNTVTSLQYEEGLSDRDIIIDMVGRFPGTALGTYGLDAAKDRYRVGGNNFVGKHITSLDKMLAKYHLDYAYTNGKIVIIPYRFTPEEYAKFAPNNYNLTDDLIKTISPVTDKTGVSSNDSKAKVRKLQIGTFFLPLEIGQFITIQNSEVDAIKQYEGTYVCKARRVVLNPTGSWDTVIECEEITV